ncbi:MAG: cobalamin biosynthesis protein CobD [Nitrospira sp. SB0677_bin_15]|nr:cobalamin biosynthesis protein CobD [Nitrospira sp. SB0677_bin_15]
MVESMLTVNLLAICALDGLLGDPRWMPHPVRWMGACINRCEPVLRKRCISAVSRRVAGCILAVFVPVFSFLAAWGLLHVAFLAHPWFGNLLWILLGYTTLAAKDLANHAWEVYHRLCSGSLQEARQAVSLMVGRDTARLTETEISGAAIESVAENTSDGVVAPLFYLVIGGPPLALAYKAVNTLDSMIGHQNEPYRDIGWASAKLDDLVNFIPSRLSAGLLVVSAHIRHAAVANAWKIYRRDCSRHASPNSGHPEAAMAGALGILLGGPATYGGVQVERPQIGDSANLPQPRHVPMAIALMWISSGLAILLALVCATLWNSL